MSTPTRIPNSHAPSTRPAYTEWLSDLADPEATSKCLHDLEYWLRSVAMHTGQASASTSTPASTQHGAGSSSEELGCASIVIVGTHMDSVPDPAQHKKISDLLFNALHLTPAWPYIVPNKEGRGPMGTTTLSFFPVDNVRTKPEILNPTYPTL